MEIPSKINNIIQRLLESENDWKALYMASWGCVLFYLEPNFKNTDLWEKPLKFGLPASRKGYQEYTPSQLCEILKSKDGYFTLLHLQTLFSLLEELIGELCPIVCNGENINPSFFENCKKFLSGDTPYQNFKTKISQDEIKELKLIKETRNCFIHNKSMVDTKWIESFKDARGKISITKIGDELPVNVQQVEEWHELLRQIVSKIKIAISLIK